MSRVNQVNQLANEDLEMDSLAWGVKKSSIRPRDPSTQNAGRAEVTALQVVRVQVHLENTHGSYFRHCRFLLRLRTKHHYQQCTVTRETQGQKHRCCEGGIVVGQHDQHG